MAFIEDVALISCTVYNPLSSELTYVLEPYQISRVSCYTLLDSAALCKSIIHNSGNKSSFINVFALLLRLVLFCVCPAYSRV